LKDALSSFRRIITCNATCQKVQEKEWLRNLLVMDRQQKVLYVGQQRNVKLGPAGSVISRTSLRIANLSK